MSLAASYEDQLSSSQGSKMSTAWVPSPKWLLPL